MEFIRFALDAGVLRFGQFRTKAGRDSPYFFNAGLFNDGARLGRLAEFYGATLLAAEQAGQLRFDMLFGPAYKGITLIGAPLRGRVVIVDDVISAGTSVRESVDIIRAAGAEPAAVLIALDRRERGGNATEVTEQSAVQQVQAMFGIPVLSIASLDDVVAFLEQSGQAGELAAYREQVSAYRTRYGV